MPPVPTKILFVYVCLPRFCSDDMFWTFYNQTLHGGTSSSPAVSCERNGLLFSGSRSQWWLIYLKFDYYATSSELMILLQPNLVWWCISLAGVSCANIVLLYRRPKSQRSLLQAVFFFFVVLLCRHSVGNLFWFIFIFNRALVMPSSSHVLLFAVLFILSLLQLFLAS